MFCLLHLNVKSNVPTRDTNSNHNVGYLSMKRRIVRPLAAGAVAVMVAGGGWLALDSLRAGETHSVDSSYAFDVSDKAKVAGFADYVIVGTIKGVADVQDRDGPPYTVFDVTVDQTLKGASRSRRCASCS
ncbi:hypothetical protein [Micromonospora sp. NPDC049204]|uniref:hypothetical protein n=1 Tax=Micromonospora sp. NPDC049204 TaxID=3154351 RepID=UPI0033E0AF25